MPKKTQSAEDLCVHLGWNNYVCPERALRFLVLHEDRDKGAFDILKRVLTIRLFRDEIISHEEIFLSDRSWQKYVFPRQQREKKLATGFAINLHCLFLTRLLCENFDINLTRNDEVKVGASACDAVSEALASCGVHKRWCVINELLLHKSNCRFRKTADTVDEYKADRLSQTIASDSTQ